METPPCWGICLILVQTCMIIKKRRTIEFGHQQVLPIFLFYSTSFYQVKFCTHLPILATSCKIFVALLWRLAEQEHCRWGDVGVQEILNRRYFIIIVMISQQLIRQAAREEDNDRVYKVELCSRSITHISGLKPFGKLRCLQLGFNRIRCIENLDCLPDLRELHLEHNEITKLNGLETNKVLTVLTLTGNRIEKIQNIGHLIKLQTLLLDSNRIEKIAGLETLKDLKTLTLSGNKLSSIDSLPAFSKLEVLIADNNKIQMVSPSIFAKSTKLLRLSLASNQLQDISFLNSLASLEELNLSNNKITELSVGPLKNLEYLNVSRNKISNLPKLSLLFPELSVFLFAHNEIAMAEAEMLVQIDFRGNFMQNPDFAETIYKVYGFDRINQKNYNKPGTRYVNQAHEIKKILKEQGLGDIENDEDVRKIIMSGFYNDDLEAEMTGVKPDRPTSGSKNRINSSFNFEDMERSFNEIVNNEKRLQYLRNKCMQIFQSNNIKVEFLTRPKYEQDSLRESQQNSGLITESKNLADKTTSINTVSDLASKNEENANKWKQLKNREKSFNIRGVVRKMSGSQRKSGPGTILKEGSVSKIGSQERSELMKTQLNPPRWNNDPNLMRTTQARPFSAKKKQK